MPEDASRNRQSHRAIVPTSVGADAATTQDIPDDAPHRETTVCPCLPHGNVGRPGWFMPGALPEIRRRFPTRAIPLPVKRPPFLPSGTGHNSDSGLLPPAVAQNSAGSERFPLFRSRLIFSPEHPAFETRWRFFRLLRAGRAVPPHRVLSFSKLKRSRGAFPRKNNAVVIRPERRAFTLPCPPYGQARHGDLPHPAARRACRSAPDAPPCRHENASARGRPAAASA